MKIAATPPLRDSPTLAYIGWCGAIPNLPKPKRSAIVSKQEHNYERKQREMIAAGKIPCEIGHATIIHVSHDDWCGVYDAGRCNCDPDITYTSTVPERRLNASRN